VFTLLALASRRQRWDRRPRGRQETRWTCAWCASSRSVARLTAWVPWLCVPDSHRVCPYRPARSAGKPILHEPGLGAHHPFDQWCL